MVRFWRQPNRVIGAFGTPLLFWFLIGSGLGRSFQTPAGPGLSYLQYFFPGMLLMIVLFTAIFSTISIIEDRKEGFLQGVLVAPVHRSAIVLGKLLGGGLLAFAQALLLLALSPLLGVYLTFAHFCYAALVLFLLSVGLTGLGFVIAWRMDSTQGFHAVMNLFLMPLWFLSGALFPPDGAPAWLGAVMRANPLSYGVSALHRSLYQGFDASSYLPSAGLCLAVVASFTLAMFLLSSFMASRVKTTGA